MTRKKGKRRCWPWHDAQFHWSHHLAILFLPLVLLGRGVLASRCCLCCSVGTVWDLPVFAPFSGGTVATRLAPSFLFLRKAKSSNQASASSSCRIRCTNDTVVRLNKNGAKKTAGKHRKAPTCNNPSLPSHLQANNQTIRTCKKTNAQTIRIKKATATANTAAPIIKFLPVEINTTTSLLFS